MIIYVRSYLSEYDSRLQKYFRSLELSLQVYYFVGWKKGPHARTFGDHFGRLYQNPAALGGGFRNILAVIFWNVFILKSLFSLRSKISVVHAVDLDCAVASYVFAKLFRKKFVFDIFDKYSAVRNLGYILNLTADWLEQYLSRHSDLTIIAAEERISQHRLQNYSGALLVLENVPGIEIPYIPVRFYREKWRIGYFGVLEAGHRGLEDLLELAACSNVELHIVGYGKLEPVVREAAARHTNIVFHGPASSDRGLSIMRDMHVLAALYYKTTPNHIHAAPNKYYEHLMLGRPLLTTRGTPPGTRVASAGTGWAIEEGPQALMDWLSALDQLFVRKAAAKARELWEERYMTYFDAYYLKKYSMLMRQMAEPQS